jgi:type I restriction enzyme, S subunit
MQVATPKTWETLNFTSLILDNKSKKQKIQTSDYLEAGEIPIIDQGQDIIAGYTNDTSLIYNGDLPVIVFGDHTLVLKFIDFPFAIGADGTKIIHSNQEKCTPKFFYYAINAKNIQSEGYKRHFSKLRDQTFLIPPLPEQKQIASILSNVDDTIQKTDQIIKQTQRLKKAMMQKLLTRGIGHSKFKKVRWFFGKEIEIPEKWEIFLLKDISENGLMNGLFKRKSEFGSGTPLINVFDLYTGIDIDVNNLQKVKVTEKELKKFHVKIGDIFFDRSSLVLEGIGHSNIILKKSEPVVFECHIMKLSTKDIIIPEFLLYFTKSTLFRNYVMSIAKVATMTTISQPDLESAKILIPSQSEQKQIVSILSNIDTQIQKEKIHKSNLERLKKGLMQKLLTGQIRVKVR